MVWWLDEWSVEREMSCVVGKKGSREGGGDLSNILQGKLRKCPQ